MKPPFIILAALFVGCAKGDQMKHLEERWAAVASSTSAQTEETAVERVWDVVEKERFSIQMRGEAPNGGDVDMTSTKDVSGIKSVHVTFAKDGASKTFVWTPIDVANAYILFRE